VQHVSHAFADIIPVRHETLRGIVDGAKWPPVFVHRPLNCKKIAVFCRN